jgi:hypothetical protein
MERAPRIVAKTMSTAAVGPASCAGPRSATLTPMALIAIRPGTRPRAAAALLLVNMRTRRRRHSGSLFGCSGCCRPTR